MTKEKKELLTKDVCSRIPYHLKVNYAGKVYDVVGYTNNKLIIVLPFMSYLEGHSIEFCKPYLRPMPDIQDPILNELDELITNKKFYEITSISQDWYNKHHFDYHGLISMGLALEAKEGMYND